MEFKVSSVSPEATKNWGHKLGEFLRGGDIVCLRGELGAGKTAFSQGVGEALGILQPLTSPTFTLMQEYRAKIKDETYRLVHMDLYRLQHPEEVEVIGVEDAFQPDTICLIEWPEIAEDYLPENRLDITIEGSGESPRALIFYTESDKWFDRLNKLRGEG